MPRRQTGCSRALRAGSRQCRFRRTPPPAARARSSMHSHIAASSEQTSDLALIAAQRALAAAHLAPGDVDLIIVATTTPDMVFPSTACILQDKLGTKNCPAFDIQAVCSGFVYALSIADRIVATGGAQN